VAGRWRSGGIGGKAFYCRAAETGFGAKGDTEEEEEERKKERKKELARRGPGHGVESARICLHECTHR
jgi:hypothetical protein